MDETPTPTPHASARTHTCVLFQTQVPWLLEATYACGISNLYACMHMCMHVFELNK
jgi:hypothetical protein